MPESLPQKPPKSQTNSEKTELFNQNLLAACTDGKWGYIDKTGSYVIEPQFDDAKPFSDNGLAVVKSGKQYGYIDKTGSYVVNPQFDSADSFSDNDLAVVESGDRYGYIDKTGSYVINPQFDGANSFVDGVAVVETGDKYALIDAQGKYITAATYYSAVETYAHSGMLYFVDNNKIGYLNASGEEAIPAQFDSIVKVKSKSKYSTYSFYSNKASGGSFYDDGYAIVRMGDKFGVIDKKGNYVINAQFDGLDSHSAGTTK